MSKKIQFNRLPDPFGNAQRELENSALFISAQLAVKTKDPIYWHFLAGKKPLAGFIGRSYSSVHRLVRSGKLSNFLIGGVYFFLIQDIVQTINDYPELSRSNFATYHHPGTEEDTSMIHWIKYPYPDHILVKFTYQMWTSYLTLPFEFWRKNSKIIKAIIRAINERNKIFPFIHQNNPENE